MKALYPSFLQEVWDYFVYFMTVFIIVSFIYAFMRFAVFNSIKISGSSMFPYHQTGDIIYIDLLSKHFGTFQRGDVVVLDSPDNCSEKKDTLFIKRIIGLPGEQVIFENGEVFIFNPEISEEPVLLDESDYIPRDMKTYKNITPPLPNKPDFEGKFEEKVLGDNEYYFMGDNRTGSIDGRKCGPLPQSMIVGKEFYRFDGDNSRFTSLPKYNIQNQF